MSHIKFPKIFLISLVFVLGLLLPGYSVAGGDSITAEHADLNDDGTVSFSDIWVMYSVLNARSGESRYREELDLDHNGIIDFQDYRLILAFFRQNNISTDPTTFEGNVYDGTGAPLEGIRVFIGDNSVEGCSDQSGRYALTLGPGDVGQTTVTFDGTGGAICIPVDPSPGLLSGQYPTIPNKPVFINGGTVNTFRDISLPERDLNGAVDLSNGIATLQPNGDWLLNQPVQYSNGGVEMMIPAGCTATFPAGEDPVLSITRVDPSMLPVPMPPGLASTIFVTYQPGGTQVTCPGADPVLTTTFDNVDGFVNDLDNDDGADFPDLADDDTSFLAGVVNGIFVPLAPITVGDFDANGDFIPSPHGVAGPKLLAQVPVPFDFAWYHVDIPRTPCPRTTVTGFVTLNDISMTAVAGAQVSVPGIGAVPTAADGSFSIPNVPAGPNGPNCTSNPFSLRASAANGVDFGASSFVPAVPGGLTNVGTIKFGVSGTVQGKVYKLLSVNPFIPAPIPGTQITVDSLPSPAGDTVTDVNGGYNVSNVPVGGYNVSAFYEGGAAGNIFSGSQSGNIDFNGDINIHDFKFTGFGSVKVTVVDSNGIPLPNIDLTLESFGGDLGNGFVANPDFKFGFTDANGMFTFEGVPQGACELTVQQFGFVEIPVVLARVGSEDGCVVNQLDGLLDLGEVQAQVPGDVDSVTITQDVVDSGNQKFTISYARPFNSDSFFDFFVEVEIDTDQNINTGDASNITSRSPSPNPTNLGVEVRILCSNSNCTLVITETGDTLVVSAPIRVTDVNGDITALEFTIPVVELTNSSLGAGPYNIAILHETFNGSGGGGFGLFEVSAATGFGFGGVLDVIPNGGSVSFDPNGTLQQFDDPLGDTFSDLSGTDL